MSRKNTTCTWFILILCTSIRACYSNQQERDQISCIPGISTSTASSSPGTNDQQPACSATDSIDFQRHPPPHDEDYEKKTNKPLKIAASFTTAHRPAAFRRAYHSFRHRCLDCDALIHTWFVVDDFSSAEDVAAMQKVAPPCSGVEWPVKGPHKKGHVGSLNTILDLILGEEQQYEYLVFLEDDWLFFKDENFIIKALEIMEADVTIGQVLFNDNYRELGSEAEKQRLLPGDAKATPSGAPYFVHRYVGARDSPEWREVHSKAPGKVSHYHWPHFSLRPGVWRLSVFKELGRFEEVKGHAMSEYRYALRYAEKGYKTAFLPDVYAFHLAPLEKTRQKAGGDVLKMYNTLGLKIADDEATISSAYTLASPGGSS